MNASTIIILAVLVLIVALIIKGMIRDRKSGKTCSGCSGGCSGCGGSGCHSTEQITGKH